MINLVVGKRKPMRQTVNQLCFLLDFSPADFWLFSLRRRFFKAESNSSFDRNGRTLGPTFLGTSVDVVAGPAGSSSVFSSGAASPPSTYSSS